MRGVGLKAHLPLLRTNIVLFGLLLLLAWTLTSFERNSRLERQNVDESSWQYAVATDYAYSAPPQNNWFPYITGISSELDAYWLRISLPKDAIREPQLWILNVSSLSVYSDGDRIYAYNPEEHAERLNTNYHWNLVPLPTPHSSELVLLLKQQGDIHLAPKIYLIGKGDFTSYLIQKDIDALIFGAIFIFFFCISIYLYSINKANLHLYLALVACCGCYSVVVRTYLIQLLWDQPWLSYLELTIFPLGVFGTLSIMIELLHSNHTHVLRILRWIILAFTVFTFITSLTLNNSLFVLYLSYPLLALFGVTAFFILYTIWKSYRDKQDADSITMLSGFLMLTFTASIHVIRNYTTGLYGYIIRQLELSSVIPVDILSLGLLLFIFCLSRIIIHRFSLMNQQLSLFNTDLENMVIRRTAELHERELELQEASMKLTLSLRETAEASASTMVLEERHRITGTIHDTIGHSLTATIVQLEAAKRLLTRDPALAEQKLVASQGLVRRGLEDIRQSIRLVRNDSTQYDLHEAMLSLVNETEKTTGVRIIARIDPIPVELTVLKKRVLFQALQEGLTNGIRHGDSTHFEFTLMMNNKYLDFTLNSNGHTYAPTKFGFGLQTMADRVQQFGGKITIDPGTPGCILKIQLPIEENGGVYRDKP
ncbi:MAG: histidine kinase [Candidatus Cohnella colombiensis]|uniref:histidine kinase n=1 Tax=Candidatus Cohnella colombiensis TaxID=3121368 RepID=A0AA95EXB6_9BACL|nr:MAG: histidine kinase [Cohnella sp.]